MELQSKHYEGWNLRQEYSKCSKENCTICKNSDGHGPYWYAYKRIDTKLVRKYLGKTIPDNINEKLNISADIKKKANKQSIVLPEGKYELIKVVAEVKENGKKKTVVLFDDSMQK